MRRAAGFWIVSLLGVALGALPVRADSAAAPRDVATSARLDGVYLTLGPLGVLTRVHGQTTTGTGLELSVVHVDEHAWLAAYGVAVGGVGYTERDGGRLWLEAEVAHQGSLPVAIGLGLGVTAEVDPVRPPRFGAQATLWVFAGIVPYVRVGTLAQAGTYLEAGIIIKVPVAQFR
mgnify:CR=1 FL=1